MKGFVEFMKAYWLLFAMLLVPAVLYFVLKNFMQF